MQIEQMNLDWHRKKTVSVKKRGNLMLVVPTVSRGVKAKTRCVWPSQFDTDSKYLSRRIWGRVTEL